MADGRPTSALFALALSWRRACRAEFEDHLEAAYAAAETATNGVLLNDRGRAAGVDPYTLLYGPRVRVDAYASPELVEHLDDVGRMTYQQFENAWAANLGAPE